MNRATQFLFVLMWMLKTVAPIRGADSYPSSPNQRSVTTYPDFSLTASGSMISDLMERRTHGDASAQKDAMSHLKYLHGKIASIQVPLIFAKGRIPLPSIMIENPLGFNGGGDSEPFLSSISKNDAEFESYFAFVLLTMLLPPDQVMQSLDDYPAGNSVSMAHVLTAQAFLSAPPGSKITPAISKHLWDNLHRSSNPINRLVALEKFDSVEQSPAELLGLYRECLFGACSYLEVRALEAITRNKDFREEVAKLLEEYIASNPPANDGTLPGLRNNFPNLIEGAKRVIAMIRNTDQSAAPTDPSAQTTPKPPPPVVQSPAPKKVPEAKTVSTGEEPASTLWLVWTVLIVAAIGLLSLVLNRRK